MLLRPPTADYILRNVDSDLWRSVKSAAALQGVSIRDLLIEALKRFAEGGK